MAESTYNPDLQASDVYHSAAMEGDTPLEYQPLSGMEVAPATKNPFYVGYKSMYDEAYGAYDKFEDAGFDVMSGITTAASFASPFEALYSPFLERERARSMPGYEPIDDSASSEGGSGGAPVFRDLEGSIREVQENIDLGPISPDQATSELAQMREGQRVAKWRHEYDRTQLRQRDELIGGGYYERMRDILGEFGDMTTEERQQLQAAADTRKIEQGESLQRRGLFGAAASGTMERGIQADADMLELARQEQQNKLGLMLETGLSKDALDSRETMHKNQYDMAARGLQGSILGQTAIAPVVQAKSTATATTRGAYRAAVANVESAALQSSLRYQDSHSADANAYAAQLKLLASREKRAGDASSFATQQMLDAFIGLVGINSDYKSIAAIMKAAPTASLAPFEY